MTMINDDNANLCILHPESGVPRPPFSWIQQLQFRTHLEDLVEGLVRKDVLPTVRIPGDLYLAGPEVPQHDTLIPEVTRKVDVEAVLLHVPLGHLGAIPLSAHTGEECTD